MSFQSRTTLKVVMVGDEKAGKTCLLKRLINDSFSEEYRHTVGVGFRYVDLSPECTLQIWDCSGSNHLRSMVLPYLRGVDAVILVNDDSTVSNLKSWCNDIKKYAPNDVPMFLVNTKVKLAPDVQHDSTISFRFADAKGDPNSVTELFQRVAEEALLFHRKKVPNEFEDEIALKLERDVQSVALKLQSDAQKLQARAKKNQEEKETFKLFLDFTLFASKMQALQVPEIKHAQAVEVPDREDFEKFAKIAQTIPVSTYRAIRTHIIPESILDLTFRGHTARKPTVDEMADSVGFLLRNRLRLHHRGSSVTYTSDMHSAYIELIGTIRELMSSALQKAEEQKAWATQERSATVDPAVLQSFKDWLKKVEDMPEMSSAKWNVIREGFLPDSELGKCF